MPAARTVSASPVKTGLAETVVQTHVDAVCGWLGLAHYHTKDSRGSTSRGFLDSFVVGPGGALAIECKDDDGRTTAEQDLWAWLFEHVLGIRVLLVRPEDTLNRPEYGGKSRIQVELEKLAFDAGGQRFPTHVRQAINLARNAQARNLAAAIAKGRARHR